MSVFRHIYVKNKEISMIEPIAIVLGIFNM